MSKLERCVTPAGGYGISDCPSTHGSVLDFPGLFPYVSKESISNGGVNFGDFRENTS